jgi:DNA-binding NtrC family response regulator
MVTETPTLHVPLRVLLVDDHPLMLKALGDIVRHDGHDVSTAIGVSNAIAAIEALRARGGRFDAMITDCSMTDGNGIELAAEVHALSPTTPVILLSAYDFSEADDEAMVFVAATLRKPPRIEDLRAALQRVSPSAVVPADTDRG